jgi:hypothetical protein
MAEATKGNKTDRTGVALSYRPRATEVRAIRWTGEDNTAVVLAFAENGTYAFPIRDDTIMVRGYGFHSAHVGDYIVRHGYGQYTVYSPEVFAELYEPLYGPAEPAGV